MEALEALYATDVMGAAAELEELSARARRFVSGVLEHRSSLDEEIASASTAWRIERMPVVDRNIIRLALYELRHTETPVGVVISEAVEIAKRYSTARSGRFVNGVLGALAGGRQQDPD